MLAVPARRRRVHHAHMPLQFLISLPLPPCHLPSPLLGGASCSLGGGLPSLICVPYLFWVHYLQHFHHACQKISSVQHRFLAWQHLHRLSRFYMLHTGPFGGWLYACGAFCPDVAADIVVSSSSTCVLALLYSLCVPLLSPLVSGFSAVYAVTCWRFCACLRALRAFMLYGWYGL